MSVDSAQYVTLKSSHTNDVQTNRFENWFQQNVIREVVFYVGPQRTKIPFSLLELASVSSVMCETFEVDIDRSPTVLALDYSRETVLSLQALLMRGKSHPGNRNQQYEVLSLCKTLGIHIELDLQIVRNGDADQEKNKNNFADSSSNEASSPTVNIRRSRRILHRSYGRLYSQSPPYRNRETPVTDVAKRHSVCEDDASVLRRDPTSSQHLKRIKLLPSFNSCESPQNENNERDPTSSQYSKRIKLLPSFNLCVSPQNENNLSQTEERAVDDKTLEHHNSVFQENTVRRSKRTIHVSEKVSSYLQNAKKRRMAKNKELLDASDVGTSETNQSGKMPTKLVIQEQKTSKVNCVVNERSKRSPHLTEKGASFLESTRKRHTSNNKIESHSANPDAVRSKNYQTSIISTDCATRKSANLKNSEVSYSTNNGSVESNSEQTFKIFTELGPGESLVNRQNVLQSERSRRSVHLTEDVACFLENSKKRSTSNKTGLNAVPVSAKVNHMTKVPEEHGTEEAVIHEPNPTVNDRPKRATRLTEKGASFLEGSKRRRLSKSKETLNNTKDLRVSNRDSRTSEVPTEYGTVQANAVNKPHLNSNNQKTVRPQHAFSCPVDDCTKMFSCKSTACSHILEHYLSKEAIENCRKTARHEDTLRCTLCSYSGANDSTLFKHLISHNHLGLKVYKCPKCDLTFRDPTSLAYHFVSHWPRALWCLECFYCNKLFDSVCALAKHNKYSHENIYPYKCTYCSRAFSTGEALTKHTRMHTGERPYKCTECDAAFAQVSNLISHMRTHEKNRRFTVWCSICKRGYYHVRELRRHMATSHSQTNKFQCTECKKFYSDKATLKCHMRIHTGEKPYECDICHEKFYSASLRSRHCDLKH